MEAQHDIVIEPIHVLLVGVVRKKQIQKRYDTKKQSLHKSFFQNVEKKRV